MDLSSSYMALRRVYGQGRWMTALKTLGLVSCYAQLLQLPLGISMLIISLSI